MKLNRKWLLAIALLLSMAVATAGTLAYLTDRDTVENTFTMGSVDIEVEEDFPEEGAPIEPGQEVNKDAKIVNDGTNPAWVWMTVSVPEELKDYVTLNWANGFEPISTTPEIVDGQAVWTVLVEDQLPAGESTEYILDSVTLSKYVDYQDGKYVAVKDGDPVVLESLEGGKFDVTVNGFATQVDELATVEAAYEAYVGQWGGLNGGASDADYDTWDGTSDTSWYNDADTEFVITTAEQLAGFAELVDGGETFEDKTVKLGNDIDLYVTDENGEAIPFEPIGSYRKDTPFKGNFDGQGYTISNMSQNTWALDNGYNYGDLGLGLFGLVEDANIKNLTMDGASISGESAICGTVAACAYGDTTFENVTVKNTEVADYQYYAGGIVGWASGNHQYIGCKVDETTTVGAQWGDFDNSNGGIIGGCGGTATILLKDCEVSCRIDAYNDVTSSYQWYAYRRSGMLIGNPGKTVVVDGTTYAAAPQLTCENVTVTYGDWANYTYCEFAGKSWPYVRVQAGISNSAYSNPRYGHPTDANGNEVVDDSHVHNEGEDHFIECTFDQLYGGGQGVYGDPTHDGVTVVYDNK